MKSQVVSVGIFSKGLQCHLSHKIEYGMDDVEIQSIYTVRAWGAETVSDAVEEQIWFRAASRPAIFLSDTSNFASRMASRDGMSADINYDQHY